MKPSTLFFSLIAAITITFAACKKEENATYVNASSITIIRHPGFAPAGTPSDYFLINNEGVFKDTTTVPGKNDGHQFNYQLDEQKYDQVKYILNEVPDVLLKMNGQELENSNDYADCARHRVKATINGTDYEWTFEDCTDGMKKNEKAFADKIIALNSTLKL